jgi:hypothetical protein
MFVEMPLDNARLVKFTLPAAGRLALPKAFEPFGTSAPTKRSNISRRLAVL